MRIKVWKGDVLRCKLDLIYELDAYTLTIPKKNYIGVRLQWKVSFLEY